MMGMCSSFAISALRTALSTALRLFIDFGEELLRAVHQAFPAVLQSIDLAVGQAVAVLGLLDGLLQRGNICLHRALCGGIELVTHILHGLLGLEDDGVRVVAGVDAFLANRSNKILNLKLHRLPPFVKFYRNR